MADWKKFVSSNKLDIGFSIAGVAVDIFEGKGVVKSIGAGVLDFAKFDLIGGIVGGPAMSLYMLGQLGVLGANVAIEAGKVKTEKVSRNISGPGSIGGHGFFDNQNAYTMRQRGLAAIGGHQGMVNNALGSEARRRAYNIRY